MESERMAEVDAAQAQLAALRSGRAALADRAVQPWWHDVLAGLLVLELFAALAARDRAVTVVGLVVFLVGLRLLVWAYQRVTGFWVNGLRAGRTRRATTTWFVLYALVVVPALVLGYGFDQRWALVVAGAVLGVVLGVAVAVISRWWTRIYVRELRAAL